MRFFYVKKNITLQLPHKRQVLISPPHEALATLQIPTRNVYCGNIEWEAIHAKKTAGDDEVVVMPTTTDIQRLLPPVIRPWSAENDLVMQLQSIKLSRPRERLHEPIKLALINGVGTMLGDTLVGSSAVEIALRRLIEAIGPVEVHAILAWNARPGAENILARSPVISHVLGHSITLESLSSYDAYWDFTTLLRMKGYDSLPLVDFYLSSLGIDPQSVDPVEKLPVLRLPTVLVTEAKSLLAEGSSGRKVVLIQGLASTPIRSMPPAFLAKLIDDVLIKTDFSVLLTQPLPDGLSNNYPGRIVFLEDWCKASTDHYLAMVVAADAILSTDTLAIHAAMAVGMPGVVIFTTLSPGLRLAYAPHLAGVVIPEASSLRTWGKHKDDDNWLNEKIEYDQAWGSMDRNAIVNILSESVLRHTETIPAQTGL